MALSRGTRLGSYEILSAIGAGGMGEVYRARDSRLNRDVAIKILPPAFTADADRLARFEREARVLASLNHPHIAAIYGFALAPDGAGATAVMNARIADVAQPLPRIFLQTSAEQPRHRVGHAGWQGHDGAPTPYLVLSASPGNRRHRAQFVEEVEHLPTFRAP